jgi:REP element-mobilizing transposase RayT
VDCGSEPQFVTFRLEDSLPAEVYAEWIKELGGLLDDERRRVISMRVEKYLDSCHGCCVLRNPVAAKIVQDALFHAHVRKCIMHAWVVMPNHVHVAMTPGAGLTVGEVVGPLKGYTAHEIHRKLGGASGRLWQPDSFDKVIRDTDHFNRVVGYIEWNPVKAKLCSDPAAWPYSSANPKVMAEMKRRLEGG